MKQLYFVSSLFLIILFLLPYYEQSEINAAEVHFATYTPIPMHSTSSMLPQTEPAMITGTGWTKPGTWQEPYNDDQGGSDYKPDQWEDPYLTPNPETAPIGDVWTLLLFAIGYVGWLCWRKAQSQSLKK